MQPRLEMNVLPENIMSNPKRDRVRGDALQPTTLIV